MADAVTSNEVTPSDAAARQRRRTPVPLHVLRTESVTRHMWRVVFGTPEFDEFFRRYAGFTDSYVKLQFPEAVRTYTLRWIDPEIRELAIDFVVHGDEGVAGPWAANAKPGDELAMVGPGGAYAPSDDVAWHLLAGDEAAIPAIQAALEAMPAGARAYVFIEVDGIEDEQKLETGATVAATWLHRDGAPAGSTTLIADAIKGWEWPKGQPDVFVHGEAGLLKQLRSYLLTDRELPRELVSISGYWRCGNNEEGFRAWKAEQAPA